MSAFATILLYLVGLAISLTISFFLIRGAVDSAMSNILGRYSTPGKIENELKGISETLRQIQVSLAANLVSSNASASGAPAAPHGTIDFGEAASPSDPNSPARLIPAADDMGVCSHCGKTQRNNRRICWNCGAMFAGQTDKAETETE